MRNWWCGPSRIATSRSGRSSGTPGNLVQSLSKSDYLGWGTGAGDVNGDGVDDVIFIALRGDGLNDTRGWAGDAYVLFGRRTTAEARTLLEVIQSLPEDAFVRQGHRQAMLIHAQSIEDMLDTGQTGGAARLLDQMKRHLGPCDPQPGQDNWLQSCTASLHLGCRVEQMGNALPAPSGETGS